MKTMILILFVGMGIICVQCNTSNKPATGKGTDSIAVTKDNANDSVPGDGTVAETASNGTDSFSNISFLLPSPDEILGEILTGKIEFSAGLINDKSNAVNYIDTKHRALNLGIFVTDLAYLNLNDRKSDALEYFKVIRDLAQKINIYSVFNEDLYNRIQNNLTQKDSLNKISKELYYNMLGVLESSKRNNVYALVASGALMEALYLSTATVTKFSEFHEIAQKIFEQKYIIENFYEFTSQFKSDNDVRSVLDQFNNLKDILNKTGTINTEKSVTMDKKDHMIIGGGEEIIVSEQAFRTFKDNVKKIRQEIVNPGHK